MTTTFRDDGVPLRCQLCGGEVGRILTPLDGPTPPQPDPDLVVVRCYRCAAVEEAERITEGSA